MKILSILSVGIFFLYSTRCDTPLGKKLVNSINYFTLNLYKELLKTEKGNVICSGFSLSSVLAMLLVGARGNTATEIYNTLGYNKYGLSEQQIKDSFRQLLTYQSGKHSGYDLDIANSVWLQSGFSALPDFVASLNNDFFVEGKHLNFGNTFANTQINAWVNEKTKGRIPTLFDDPLHPSTLLVLANTVYFKGSWLEKFDERYSRNAPFISKENTKEVPMMFNRKKFLYSNSSNLRAQILEMPYTGEDVSMIILLPTKKDGLESLENELTLESLNEAIALTSESEVGVTIPKFTISSKLPLNTILQSLGIVKAFSQLEADLSGISVGKNLHVSDSIQKADIEVNEEGTVASVASGHRITAYSALNIVYFNANHPFLFIIRQKSTGIFLFIGRVAKL